MISRPPDTRSRTTVFCPGFAEPTYSNLSDGEIDRLILKCRRAIASHMQDSLSKDVETAETALVAVDVVKAVLRDVLAIAATEKRAKIQALLERG